ncbi:hypothetical protein Tco_0895993 [Tanacetum coccineum]|uniref:Uncharacterized protein n=1 Tax=Tanacetum coccineum TaxID=301880 RepID=A0ABQ5CJK0_9ASTR
MLVDRIVSFVGDVGRPASALYDYFMTETSCINNVGAKAVSFFGGCVPDARLAGLLLLFLLPESCSTVSFNVFHEWEIGIAESGPATDPVTCHMGSSGHPRGPPVGLRLKTQCAHQLDSGSLGGSDLQSPFSSVGFSEAVEPFVPFVHGGLIIEIVRILAGQVTDSAAMTDKFITFDRTMLCVMLSITLYRMRRCRFDVSSRQPVRVAAMAGLSFFRPLVPYTALLVELTIGPMATHDHDADELVKGKSRVLYKKTMRVIFLLNGASNRVNTFSSGPHSNNRRTHGNAQGIEKQEQSEDELVALDGDDGTIVELRVEKTRVVE